MLYPKNKEKELSRELFENPTSEYRATPFWAWNSTLEGEELLRQIDAFEEMGFGGFHMHVRQGLETPYLEKGFMDAVKLCTERAKEKGMLAWLYDEDRWPSGCAGGIVTKNKRHRMKYMTLSTRDRENTAPTLDVFENEGLPYFCAAFSVNINEYGIMTDYRRVERYEECENKRYFFLEEAPGGQPRYNYQEYVDTLSKEAIDEFIATTYDAFKENVGEEFGKTIPAIFTDEPQTYGFRYLKSGFDKDDAGCSWTTDFEETYRNKFGASLIDKLPELFFATEMDSAKAVRYNYYSHLSERFNEAYMDNIGEWCEKNGIAMTGHLLGEDTLFEAALNNGDIMRTYRRMQLPGIDMLCDDVSFNTPLQCRSAVRQYGREGMLSELYGVTGWDFDFRGHKYQGDWQACLGVSVRVPHLAWQSMKGEGKRDYPASLSYQSSWYKEYKCIEDHYARINTAMTRGEPEVRVAVIYPVDSYNILFASRAETLNEREELDEKYKKLAEWLLSYPLDFDYLSESLLPELCPEGDNPLPVGKMQYDAVIVSECTMLRPHTIKVLKEFKAHGGKLIFVGKLPALSEGKPHKDLFALCRGAEIVRFSKHEIYKALRGYETVTMRSGDGSPTTDLMCSMRKDGDAKWLFIAHMYKPEQPHDIKRQDVSITVKGCWNPEIYDTMTGKVYGAEFEAGADKTVIYATLYDLDSLLLKLNPGKANVSCRKPADSAPRVEIYHPYKVKFKLSEPNVLLLDSARFSINSSPFYPEEEVLRIDAKVREMLSLNQRRVKVVQPWAIPNAPEDNILDLIYTVRSEIDFEGALLAMENPHKAEITFNGEEISNQAVDWYVDRDIKCVRLPQIKVGENLLKIKMPFGMRTDLEACYIVGGFGTCCKGRETFITKMPDELYFGSVVNQGMTFYGGNVEYTVPLTVEEKGDLEITVSHYRGAAVKVIFDGEEKGRIITPPFKLRISDVKPGEHKLTYVLYGTRYNTFSALHNLDAGKKRVYMGPIFWRSENESWAYEYETRPMGILKTPVVNFVSRK